MAAEKTPTHSPLPWDDASAYPYSHSVRIFARAKYVATVGNSDDTKEQTVANAAFIVKAVNCHEALVAALKDCSEVLARSAGESYQQMQDLSDAELGRLWIATFKKAQSALAQAEAHGDVVAVEGR